MTPADQTTFGSKIVAEYGNCYSACIATILDLPIDEVPTFVQTHGPDDEATGPVWWMAARAWVADRVGVDLAYTEGKPRDLFDEVPESPWQWYAIACGKSPRGDHNHCVVVDLDGNLVHDPHPDRTGIVGEPEGYEVVVAMT